MIKESKLDQLKGDFWLTAAHRLKTPLTLLRVVVGILQESDKGDKQERELVDRAVQSVKRLEYEISSLLDFLRVKSGALELNLEPADVGALLERALSEVQTTARGKHQSLRVVLEPGLPPVRVDQEAIRKVLVSLLDNAGKHTPEGGEVTIHARRAEHSVTIQVQDTGPGIPREERASIFEAYYRGKSTATPSPGQGIPGTGQGMPGTGQGIPGTGQGIPGTGQGIPGTGLGLATAKSLVEAHGSTIWVQDHEGAGAWFAFNLPLAEETSQDK